MVARKSQIYANPVKIVNLFKIFDYLNGYYTIGAITRPMLSILRESYRFVRHSFFAPGLGGNCGLVGVFLLLMLGAPLLEGAGTYKVKKGDTFYSIARAHGTTSTRLMSANGIKDPRTLRIGQTLRLSSSSGSGKSSTASKSASKSTPKVAKVGGGKRVVIDPGHGGHDRGAVWGGVRESTLNMRVASKLEYYLKERGFTTVMTFPTSVFKMSLKRFATN